MTLSDFNYPNNPGMQSIPEQYRLGSANLDFIGMGNMVAYDTMGLINDGYYNLLQESLTDPKHATKSWVVNEQVTSAFIQADLATEIADMPITGGLVFVIYTQSNLHKVVRLIRLTV